jgi:hypothetical protein
MNVEFHVTVAATRVAIRAWLNSPGIDQPFMEAGSRALIACVERARETGEIRDDVALMDAAQLMLDVYVGLLCRWVQAAEPFSLREALRTALKLTLAGLA